MKAEQCYVHLGRFGDLMILLPGWHREFHWTGKRPVVVCSHEFSSLLEGVSYVQPIIGEWDWLKGVNKARLWAERQFERVITPKWWDDPDYPIPEAKAGDPAVVLMVRGKKVQFPAKEWESYHLSEWKGAGFPEDKCLLWPLVFDKRSREREEQLRLAVFKTGKPKVLVNFSGASSPFVFAPEIMAHLRERCGQRAEIVDLAKVRATRLYDLLGLYEAAAFLVTSDTATLHLASACEKLPHVAYVNEGPLGSLTRSHCVARVPYSQALKQVGVLQPLTLL